MAELREGVLTAVGAFMLLAAPTLGSCARRLPSRHARCRVL